MRTTINAIPFHIETLGDPSLPRIIFLHGFLGSGSDWLPVARELQREYSVVMIDLPGHGSAAFHGAPKADGFFLRTIDALAELVRESAAPPCYLVGYSMGGRLALGLALRYPELFKKAVIISASPGLRSEQERAQRRESDEGVARKIERNFAGFIEFWYNQPLFSTLKSHPLFREVESARKINDPHNLALALRLLGTGRQPSFWEELQKNRLPICFFAGEKDERYVEIGHQMVNLSPDSDLELFARCGHTLQLENRELFVGRLQSFFNQQEPTKL